MAKNPKNQAAAAAAAIKRKGELSEKDLDKVAGGQEVRKMETIVVTAKRERPEQVVKMETITVTASREKPDIEGTKLAHADKARKKGGSD